MSTGRAEQIRRYEQTVAQTRQWGSPLYGDRVVELNSLYGLGQVYTKIDDELNATKYLNELIEVSSSYGMESYIAMACDALAWMHLRLGNRERALWYAQAASGAAPENERDEYESKLAALRTQSWERVTGAIACSQCGGTRYVRQRVTCVVCNGGGRVMFWSLGSVARPAMLGERGEHIGPCPDCDGTGTVERLFRCDHCDGTGREPGR